jgi:hypothetical protein
MSAYARERAHDRIAALAGEGLDLPTFWLEATEILTPVVPNYMWPCWYTLDPASLLITSHFNIHMPELPPDALAHEYYEDDVNKLVDVVRSPSGVSTLHEATGGDPSSSPRWHANMELGGDQEMIAALRTSSGIWGGLGLYREPGDPIAGCRTCQAGTGRPVGFPRRPCRWPARRFDPPRGATSRARCPLRACSPAPAPGSSCTARRS